LEALRKRSFCNRSRKKGWRKKMDYLRRQYRLESKLGLKIFSKWDESCSLNAYQVFVEAVYTLPRLTGIEKSRRTCKRIGRRSARLSHTTKKDIKDLAVRAAEENRSGFQKFRSFPNCKELELSANAAASSIIHDAAKKKKNTTRKPIMGKHRALFF